MVERAHREYTDILIYVTEVGYCSADYVRPDGEAKDPERGRLPGKGVSRCCLWYRRWRPRTGIFVWSLLDNREWEKGFSIRFGLVFVDYGTQHRIIKQSGRWYAELIAPSRG
jgi:beta-glucosidase